MRRHSQLHPHHACTGTSERQAHARRLRRESWDTPPVQSMQVDRSAPAASGSVVERLPALALAAFVLVPRWLFPDGMVADLGPAPFIIGIWGVLAIASSTRRSVWYLSALPAQRLLGFLALGSLVWILISRYASEYQPTVWVVGFALAAVVPTLVVATVAEQRRLVHMWIFVGAVLGALLPLEHLTRQALVYGTIRSATGVDIVQRWSVYRSTGPFEHPLYAATFLAVASALGLGYWLRTGSRWSLVAAIMSSAGLVATVSRGAMLAVALSVIFLLLASLRGTAQGSSSRAVLLGAALGVAGAVVPVIAIVSSRLGSGEAATSGLARTRLIGEAAELSSIAGVFGSGPGTSSRFAAQYTPLVLESSWLQLWISLGVVGLIAVSLQLVSPFFVALQRGRRYIAAAIGCFLICISGFNAIDDVPALLALFGLLCLLGGALDYDEPDPKPSRRIRKAAQPRNRSARGVL